MAKKKPVKATKKPVDAKLSVDGAWIEGGKLMLHVQETYGSPAHDVCLFDGFDGSEMAKELREVLDEWIDKRQRRLADD